MNTSRTGSRLARFKLPRYLEYVAQLPKTSSGKVAKQELRPAGRDLRSSSYDFVDGVSLELFALADGAEASAVVHGPTGVERARFTATRKGSQVELRGTAGKEIRVLFRQANALKSVEGGRAGEAAPLGAVAHWPDPSKPLRVVL